MQVHTSGSSLRKSIHMSVFAHISNPAYSRVGCCSSAEAEDGREYCPMRCMPCKKLECSCLTRKQPQLSLIEQCTMSTATLRHSLPTSVKDMRVEVTLQPLVDVKGGYTVFMD